MSLSEPFAPQQPPFGLEPHEVHAPSYQRGNLVFEARTVVSTDSNIVVQGMTGRSWIWLRKHPLLEVQVGDTVLGLWQARPVAGMTLAAFLECYDSSCTRLLRCSNTDTQVQQPHFEVFRGQPLPGVIEKRQRAHNAQESSPQSARPPRV